LPDLALMSYRDWRPERCLFRAGEDGYDGLDEIEAGKRCNAMLITEQWILRGTRDSWAAKRYFKVADSVMRFVEPSRKQSDGKH
jgi:hypothetical protein